MNYSDQQSGKPTRRGPAHPPKRRPAPTRHEPERGRPTAGPPRPPKRPRPPRVDVDAVLARASAPDYDPLAEIAAEIAERERSFSGDLADVATLRRLLRKHGLRPSKAFGQHLLVDRDALDTILAAADLHPEDDVLEVGAGTGVLTVELARRARRVVAVEIDRAILPVLRETTAPFPNVEIIPRDLLDVRPDVVFGEARYKLVANLPYYITALTLRHFLEAANPPRVLVVMVQWEVAERLAAKPGDLSLLGLSVQFYGEPRIIARVPAASFFPPPRVDSAIVRVDLFPEPPLSGAARDRFFGIAHAGFAEKRKQLHNSLERNLHLPRETIARWLTAAEIDPMRRAETLSMDDWLRLTRVVLADEASR